MYYIFTIQRNWQEIFSGRAQHPFSLAKTLDFCSLQLWLQATLEPYMYNIHIMLWIDEL